MDGTGTKRLSQEDQCHQAAVSGILEQVESVAQGVLESIQAVAGTTYLMLLPIMFLLVLMEIYTLLIPLFIRLMMIM